MVIDIKKLPFVKLSICLLIFSALACSGNSSNRENQSGLQADEAVIQWLNNGKYADLPEDSKEQFLIIAVNTITEKTPDSLKVKYFSKLSYAYMKLGDSLQFRRFNSALQNTAKAIEDNKELANSYWDLGDYFSSKSLRDSAYYHYYRAQSIFEEIGELKFAGRLLYSMALQQQKARAYVESEKTTFEALEFLEPLKDTLNLFYCYNNLGAVTKELKEYERSLQFYNKAEEFLNLMEASDRPINQRTLNNNLGNVYKEQEKWAEAIPYFEAALQYENLEIENPVKYAQTLNNLAISRLMNGDSTNVFEDLKKSYSIHELEEDNLGMSTVSYSLALYYKFSGNIKQATFFATNAIEKAELSSNYKRKLASLLLLASITPQGEQYLNEYIKLSDRLQYEERQIRDKFARIEMETDQVIAEAESLTKQRQLIIGISLGLILLGVASLIIITQRVRVQRLRFQQQQQEANQEIFNLMLSQKQKMEEGKQSEQKRISEELHDGVLGALNGIRMVLLGLNGKKDEGSISMRQDAIEKLKGVQEEIRSISHELNDAAYQKFNNFIASIQDLIRETEGSSGLVIKLHYNEELDWDALNGEIKINLYRIIQESIQNVVKHAQANKVELDFQSWDDMLKISIKDDGRGFDTRKMKKGIGHRNIKSRVEKINGTWNIESTIGKGSHITVILPYDTEATQETVVMDQKAS